MSHSTPSLAGLAIIASFSLTAVSCTNTTNADEPLEVVTVTDLAADPTVITGDGPPASTGRFTLYSLRDNKVVLPSSEADPSVRQRDSASTAWDIGFRGTTIIINGGASGPGAAQAQVLAAGFDEVLSAPEQGYATDGSNTCPGVQTPGGTFPGAPYAICTGSDNSWYTYNGALNLITPIAGRTLVIRTAKDGSYAKVRILGYYKGNPPAPDPIVHESRYYTFEFVHQPDGSRDLRIN